MALSQLGQLFKKNRGVADADGDWATRLYECLALASVQNKWFTNDNLDYALAQWSMLLKEDELRSCLGSYQKYPQNMPKTVAVIMAGNIPLVGFHDFLCVLLSGNRVLVKLSSNDKILLPFIVDFLVSMYPELGKYITFTEGALKNFDAVIATGSNNTHRYFQYYFGSYPHILRKNRNSVAVLGGHESKNELQALGEDVFRYFGLGCRSVSKVYVPENYAFDTFFDAIQDWKSVLDNHKYANNYDYNRAVFLMNDRHFFDNGFLLVTQDEKLASPISTLYYETYTDADALKNVLKTNADQLQCMVAERPMDNTISFGQTQKPGLKDYADGIDTMDFLLNL